LWEFATAVAGAFLGIDAFDQPNVQESKDLTNQFLEGYKANGKLDLPPPTFHDKGIAGLVSQNLGRPSSLKEALESLVNHVKPGDYVAVLAYLERDQKNFALLQSIRRAFLERTKAATTLGFGPRFLHSTGQLHKGGANNGVFIQIISDDKIDVPVPGQPYSFGVLKEAQALGDFRALENKGRRIIRLRLARPDKDLSALAGAVAALH
jgi:transaldolase/glucose-6-phosphate isomerase